MDNVLSSVNSYLIIILGNTAFFSSRHLQDLSIIFIVTLFLSIFHLTVVYNISNLQQNQTLANLLCSKNRFITTVMTHLISHVISYHGIMFLIENSDCRFSKIIKEYLKLLNRLYNITWFGSVYA